MTTIQSVAGRGRFAQFGIPVGGALDPFAAIAASVLVGNQPDSPVLEITVSGPSLRFSRSAAVAVTGADLSPTIDGAGVPTYVSLLVRAGSVVSFGERKTGARAYLAISGGFLISGVLGSTSTDLTSGFGGWQGRSLRAGDELPLAETGDPVLIAGRRLAGEPDATDRPARVIPGPHNDRFSSDAFAQLCDQRWRIANGNRMGYRLAGSPIHQAVADVPPLGLPVGAIQVPADGQPIVLLADHQPTGGYRVLATVAQADLPLIAQRLPGDQLRFTATSIEEARAAFRERMVASVRVSGASRWQATRQAGAHW